MKTKPTTHLCPDSKYCQGEEEGEVQGEGCGEEVGEA